MTKSITLTEPDVCNANVTKKGTDGRFIDDYGFVINRNCSCNTCDSSCSKDSNVALYQPTGILVLFMLGVMEGFNTWLVIGVWLGVVVAVALITGVRYYLK